MGIGLIDRTGDLEQSKIEVMTTIESNKIFAKFMEFKFFDYMNLPHCIYTVKVHDDLKLIFAAQNHLVDEVKFHSSWDWLMPIVKKAFDTEFFDKFDEWKVLNKKICDGLAMADIDMVYAACLSFIQWHNEQTKSGQ
jgi:hypothetical protein